MGRFYQCGEGVEKNLAEAARYFREAADDGNTRGYDLPGQYYFNGKES